MSQITSNSIWCDLEFAPNSNLVRIKSHLIRTLIDWIRNHWMRIQSKMVKYEKKKNAIFIENGKVRQITSIEHLSKFYRTSIGRSKIYRKSIENLSNIHRKSIEPLSKIYRNIYISKMYWKSIEFYRTSIEYRSKIYRTSIEIYRNQS